jgi:23S rRNA (guanosine2251-2'-O)-methyltransferase
MRAAPSLKAPCGRRGRGAAPRAGAAAGRNVPRAQAASGAAAAVVADHKRDLVYGLHAVRAVIDRAPERLLELWMAEPRQDVRARDLRERAQAAGLKVQMVANESLAKLAGDVAHQGVVASVRPLKPWDEETLIASLNDVRGPLLLVLDGVTDPHNLGACLRTADAAGVRAVILPKDRSASVDAVARKVAAGAAEFVPVVPVTNLARALGRLKQSGIWVVGTDGEAEQTLYAADLNRPLALVLGAEGEGMRRLTRDSCDFLVRIPMAGQVESLNVSVAAGIALFEAGRQRAAAGSHVPGSSS